MSTAARRTITVIVVLAVIAGLGIGGYVVWNKYFTKGSSTGPYSQQPVQTRNVSPKDFGMKSFLPLNGIGNSVEPVAYNSLRITAGTKGSNKSVVVALGNEGAAVWETEFNAPLVACSSTPMGKYLPCVFNIKDGSALATINLSRGEATWIFFTKDRLINVTAIDDSTMALLEDDLSIFEVDSLGNQKSEAMKQLEADPGQSADVSKCKVPKKPTITAPEAFRVLNKSQLLLTHNGLTQVVDRDNNQVLASTVGHVLQGYSHYQEDNAETQDTKHSVPAKTDSDISKDKDHKDDIVVAPPSSCAPALLINPKSKRTVFLPDDVVIPYTETNHIPNYVLRGGQFHTINWKAPTIGRALVNPHNLYFDGAPYLSLSEKQTIAITDDSVIGIDNKTRRITWQTSLRARYSTIIGDVALVVGRDATLYGLSMKDGRQQWSLNAPGASPIVRSDSNSVTMYAPSSFSTWAPATSSSHNSVQTGTSQTVRKVKPGIDFSPGDCIRVVKASGNGSSYKAEFTKVRCDMLGAESIVDVIDVSDVKRSAPTKDFLAYCQKNEDAYSAIVLDNPFVNNKISGVCTGQQSEESIKARQEMEAAQAQQQKEKMEKEKEAAKDKAQRDR